MRRFIDFTFLFLCGAALLYGQQIGGHPGGNSSSGSVSLTSPNSTLNLSPNPITGSGTLDLNLGHANVWAGQQTFNNLVIPDSTFLNFGTGTTGIRSINAYADMDFYVLNGNVGAFNSLGVWQLITSGGVTWGSIRGAQDTGITRAAAGVVAIGNGSAANGAGILKTAGVLPGVIYSAAGTALPTCNSTSKGSTSVVSDATSPTYMGAYTSGGTITAQVICSYDGTTYSWLTH